LQILHANQRSSVERGSGSFEGLSAYPQLCRWWLIHGGINMKTMTIRGLEPSLIDKLKENAKKHNKSLNQFVIDMLKQNMGMKKEKKFTAVYHDLDHLFGTWSDKEFEKVQGKIDSERKIDQELWK
jgi:plasmid stability protein